jgi:hypothetical protein
MQPVSIPPVHFCLHDEVEPDGVGTSVFMTISSFGPVFPRGEPAEKPSRCRLVGILNSIACYLIDRRIRPSIIFASYTQTLHF